MLPKICVASEVALDVSTPLSVSDRLDPFARLAEHMNEACRRAILLTVLAEIAPMRASQARGMDKTNIRSLIAYVLALMCVPGAYAQANASSPTTRNEIGLVIGATETPGIGLADGGTIHLNSSLALGAEYDRQLVGQHTALYGGINFVASPFDVKASFPASNVSPQYAYLFLSPHIRLKFNQSGALQPWLLFGGGYADFSPAQPRAGGVNVAGAGSTGTLEFGGGLDTKPLLYLGGFPLIGKLPIGARLEVRDFYSGQPNYGVPTGSNRQTSIVLTGGLLLRF